MKSVTNINSPTNQNSGSLYSLQKGKIPPQAVDLEEIVLGAMMIDKKGVDEVIDILHSDAFYKDTHKAIFEAIISLFEKQEPVDLKTVSYQLKKDSNLSFVGGDVYLIGLTQKVSSSAHIEFHSRIILQKYIQRRLIEISNEIIENSYDETSDVFDLLDAAESKIYDISQGNLKKNSQTAESLVSLAKTKIEEISKKEGLSGIPSGFHEIDKLTSGWQESDLIIVAARPGMGKTAFTLSMARNISVENNIPVAFFSLEMSAIQLITRLISSETGLNSEKLRTGKLEKFEWEQLNVKVSNLESAPLYIDDTPSLSIFDLRAKARRLSSQYGIKLIVLDYLQLMTVGSSQKTGNREQEISTISRNLKALAKELEIPIIALSQLSRAVELRGGTKRPILSDLRESGAIEQDADIVSFLYRPEYYKIDEWDDEDRTPSAGQAEFIVSKHRNGGLNSIKLKFISSLGKFENLNTFENPFEFQSKINNDTRINPDQAFESGSYRNEDGEDEPF
jgi:replicative DNA helicase